MCIDRPGMLLFSKYLNNNGLLHVTFVIKFAHACQMSHSLQHTTQTVCTRFFFWKWTTTTTATNGGYFYSIILTAFTKLIPLFLFQSISVAISRALASFRAKIWRMDRYCRIGLSCPNGAISAVANNNSRAVSVLIAELASLKEHFNHFYQQQQQQLCKQHQQHQ